VGAPGAGLAGESRVVEGGVVPAQAEPEAVLAGGGAVAGAHAAPRLGQRGQDLVLELDGVRRVGVADPDDRLRLARPETHAHLGLAVPARLDPATWADGDDRRVRTRPVGL